MVVTKEAGVVEDMGVGAVIMGVGVVIMGVNTSNTIVEHPTGNTMRGRHEGTAIANNTINNNARITTVVAAIVHDMAAAVAHIARLFIRPWAALWTIFSGIIPTIRAILLATTVLYATTTNNTATITDKIVDRGRNPISS